MKQVRLIAKPVVIIILAFVLLIPIGMIQDTVIERLDRHSEVMADIGKSLTGQQRVAGPLLYVPYQERIETWDYDHDKNKKLVISYKDSARIVVPEDLQITATIHPQERYRGIFKAITYQSEITLKGHFKVKEMFGLSAPKEKVHIYPASIVMGLRDIARLTNQPKLVWQNHEYPLTGGTQHNFVFESVQAQIGSLAQTTNTYDFTIQLQLQGMTKIEIAPLGKNTTIEMASTWPHPKFIGSYLPEQRDITAQGFRASWKTLDVANVIESTFQECFVNSASCHDYQGNTLGVELVEPINIYLQTERALKYALLFIGLTFVLFYLFELFKRLAIHPIQYGLVGMALAIFYLLLLSLSEHVSFLASYMIASASCILLLGFYSSYVLKSIRKSFGFMALLTLLYGVLYVLLQLEDYALLAGAGLLFLILTTIMFITRKINWYGLNESFESQIF